MTPIAQAETVITMQDLLTHDCKAVVAASAPDEDARP